MHKEMHKNIRKRCNIANGSFRQPQPGGKKARNAWASFRTLLLLGCLVGMVLFFTGCGTGHGGVSSPNSSVATSDKTEGVISWETMQQAGPDAVLEPDYATQFVIRNFGDYRLIDIADGQQILVVPEGASVPQQLPEEITVMYRPMQHLYIAASSAMDFFVALEALPQVALTSTTYENWTLPEIRQALQDGSLEYVGKYSAPDYEYILDSDCDGVVESTMIYHSPETMEQLRKLGLPVMVERSSYEANPMGRLEWIRLYGVLSGHESEAEAFFRESADRFGQVLQADNTGKSVAFFYITSNGLANVRKPGDYLANMIGLAGGNYVFDNLEVDNDSATSGMNMEMEAFYATARDADILIYNSTIDGGMDTLEQLLVKNPLLKDFKAVQQGNVWCTEKTMFQKTTATAEIIEELHRVIADNGDDTASLQFLHRLQ